MSEEALQRLMGDLEPIGQIEVALRRFNPFRVIGRVRDEAMHSDVLAFLLDPRGRHGLGDRFIKAFLDAIGRQDLAGRDYRAARIRREDQGIDILLTDPAAGLALVLENKIDAPETTDQLRRYRSDIETRCADIPDRVYLLLSPAGRPPSCPGYSAVPYAEVLRALADLRAGTEPGEVATFIDQYERLLSEEIVEESTLHQRARAFYLEHREALDFILSVRPTTAEKILDAIEAEIRSREQVPLLQRDRNTVAWVPAAWAGTAVLRDLTPPGRLLPPLQVLVFADSSVTLSVCLKGARARRAGLVAAMLRPDAVIATTPAEAEKDWIYCQRQEVLAARDLVMLTADEAARVAVEGLRAYEAALVGKAAVWLAGIPA